MKEEVASQEPEKPEVEEEKKEEVIKIEALNSKPMAFADINKKEWMSLHGKEFFDYIAKHPEING